MCSDPLGARPAHCEHVIIDAHQPLTAEAAEQEVNLHQAGLQVAEHADRIIFQPLLVRVRHRRASAHATTVDARPGTSQPISQRRRARRRFPSSPKRALARDFSSRNCVSVRFIAWQISSGLCSRR